MTETTSNIQQWVTFSLHEGSYVVPISQVLEVINRTEISSVPESPDFVAGVINVRGKVITVIDLEKRFGLEGSVQTAGKHILLIDEQARNTTTGILVDEVTSISKFSTDELQPVPATYAKHTIAPFLLGVFVEKASENLLLAIDLAKTATTPPDSFSEDTQQPAYDANPAPVVPTNQESETQ